MKIQVFSFTSVRKGRANMEKQFETRRTSTVEKSTNPVYSVTQSKHMTEPHKITPHD